MSGRIPNRAAKQEPHRGKPTQWIALLRGVNVGGKNKLPMKELVSELEALGFLDVKTYIQSGNIIFRSPPGKTQAASELATLIASCVKTRLGFQPGVIVISREDLIEAAASNPFADAEEELEGRALHLFFLDGIPAKLDAKSLDHIKRPSERWQAEGAFFYLHAPEGFGTSKLAARAERCLGVPATARNWRTVRELLKMVGSSD